jgi:uncharacterized protein DUF1775
MSTSPFTVTSPDAISILPSPPVSIRSASLRNCPSLIVSSPIGTSRMPPIMPNAGKILVRGLNHSPAASELPVVRHLTRGRRAGVVAAAAVGGVLLAAGPAMADVAVSPPSAPQGEGADLAFHVTNTGPQAISALKLTWPADTPVAEVYPLSVPDWAPRITEQKLATPLTTIHGGSPVTEVARDITWIAMPGRNLAPGASTDLSVTLGPLPTLSSMRFTVVPTYANGRTGTPMPPVDLTLTPVAPGQAADGHAGHDGAGQARTDPDAALYARTVADAERGPSWWAIAGWVVAGLAGSAAVWVVLRHRRREDEDGGEPDEDDRPVEEPKEPVAAGAPRVTSWSYRDGPGE